MVNTNTELSQNMPSIKNPKKSFNLIYIFLLIICLGISGFFYYQNQQLKQILTKKQERPITSLTPTAKISTIILSPTINQLSDKKEITYPKLPIVIFEPPLSNKDYDTQREEIQEKIVSPYLDYYKYAFGSNYLVSLLIQPQSNEKLKNQYPYTIIGIKSDNSSSWESLMQNANKLNWWTPTCMGPCKYSDEFKVKYPQIVTSTNP